MQSICLKGDWEKVQAVYGRGAWNRDKPTLQSILTKQGACLEGVRVIFVELVGAGVDDAVVGETHLRTRWQAALLQHVLSKRTTQYMMHYVDFIV